MLADETILEKLEAAIGELRLINKKLVAVNANLKILNKTTTPYDWEEEPRPEPPTPSTGERLMSHIRALQAENEKLRELAFDRPKPMYEIIGSDGSNLRFALKVMAVEDCVSNVRIVVALPSWQKKE